MGRRERAAEKVREALAAEAARLVRAFVSFNQVPAANLPPLIQSVHATLALLKYGPPKLKRPKSAVPISKSYGDDFLICLEDGRRMQTLTRYLKTRFKMTPEEYRTKWGLPANYPMITPEYARRRAGLAARMESAQKPAVSHGRGV